jgi:hypothetical protein
LIPRYVQLEHGRDGQWENAKACPKKFTATTSPVAKELKALLDSLPSQADTTQDDEWWCKKMREKALALQHIVGEILNIPPEHVFHRTTVYLAAALEQLRRINLADDEAHLEAHLEMVRDAYQYLSKLVAFIIITIVVVCSNRVVGV